MPRLLSYAAVSPGAVLLLISLVGAAQDRYSVEDVLGPWLTGKKGAVIELYRCGNGGEGRICGRIVWLREPYTDDGKLKRDPENPVASLRDRPMCGLKVVSGLTRSDDNTWSGGRVYNPKDGREYRAYLEIKEKGKIRIRAYLGLPLIGKSETWTRPGDHIDIGCPDSPRREG